MPTSWDTDAQGNVIWRPVSAFHIAPAGDIAVLARIVCSPTPQQLPASAAVQLGMTPQQALRLADDLRATAQHLLSLKGPGKPN